MDTREKLIKARLGLLVLAEQLQSVKQACRVAGISRSHYYEIKAAYEKYGAEGLVPPPRRRPRMPNQTPPELEKRIVEMTAQFPTYNKTRIPRGTPASTLPRYAEMDDLRWTFTVRYKTLGRVALCTRTWSAGMKESQGVRLFAGSEAQ